MHDRAALLALIDRLVTHGEDPVELGYYAAVFETLPEEARDLIIQNFLDELAELDALEARHRVSTPVPDEKAA